ncbi:MAG: SPOR domain-containing protein [Betaproteobacteria bacterium]|nr:SPOR domain-containing protein [Betaproteobacteria bacterium]
MRLFFLLALLTNLAFFAWTHYLAGPDTSLDPGPLTQQVAAARLRIVSAGELARVPPAAARAKLKPIPAAPPMAAAIPPTAACLEWGSFTLGDAPRAEKALEPLALGARLERRRTEELAKWWVYMSPTGGRAGALRKAAELKALGITDFYIVQDVGPYRWRISLGVFRTEDAAREHFSELRKRGVRTALIGERDTVVPKVWLQVRQATPETQVRLNDIAQTVAGSELRECPATTGGALR